VSPLARIVALADAAPPPVPQDALWERYADRHNASPLAERVWRHSGVRTRRLVANPLQEDVSTWTTAQRMRRYLTDALPLAKEALTAALAQAELPATELSQLGVVSCTGYANPGLDVHLARDLGLSPTLRRLGIGHMGCYAALPGLAAAADHVAAHRRPAALVCAELTSLHVQPGAHDAEQAVAHALFADACAAVVLTPPDDPRPGLDVIAVESLTDPRAGEDMTWDITDNGFRMTLSARVPAAVATALPALVEHLLAPHGLTVREVAHWAIHPGGPRIIDHAQAALDLHDEQVVVSREILATYGNCSSPTVLLTLARTTVAPGEHVVGLAFGPGLTLTGFLLRASVPRR
jgi:predicted naringenin-chalcone synthase